MPLLKQHFNARAFKTKSLTLLIEHGPCCILSFAAGLVGLSGLAHNPLLELCFAFAGALGGEYLGHRLFHRGGHDHGGAGSAKTLRRYGLALVFGMASWGVHQAVFHHPHGGHVNEEGKTRTEQVLTLKSHI